MSVRDQLHTAMVRTLETAGEQDPRLRALDTTRRFVDFDAHVWLLTDPVTAVGGAPLAEVPCLPELPALIRAKYLTEVNRWTALADSATPVESLARATCGNLSKSAVWRLVQCRYGVTDVASAVFADRFGVWGFLDLWRIGAEPFSAADLSLLNAVTEPLTAGLRAHQAATFRRPPAQPTGRPPSGPAVLLVDEDLAIGGHTQSSSDWLARLLPPTRGGVAVPASVYNVAAQLIAVEQGVDFRPPSSRVHLPDGGWLTLRAARLEARRSIAVTIDRSSPSDRLDLFCRAFGLTPREVEIVTQLATGVDTRQLASTAHLSAHTVQDHLKAIFAKTGVHNRRSLLSSALG